MKKRLWILALAFTPALAHAQCTLAASPTQAQIQTALNSAATNSCGGSAANTVQQVAGNTSITSQMTIPCPTTSAGLIWQGPVQATNIWPITPTAILTSTLGNNWATHGTACNNPVTIQFLQFNGGLPAGGGGGFMSVPPGQNKLTIRYNWFYGNNAIQQTEQLADTFIMFNGSTSGAQNQNDVIQWNRFGVAGGKECGGNGSDGNPAGNNAGLMALYGSGSPPNTSVCSGAGYAPPSGGAACLYQSGRDMSVIGGSCGGIGIQNNFSNLLIQNNSFADQEQPMKFYECSGMGCTWTSTGLIVRQNDFQGTHRIGAETQFNDDTAGGKFLYDSNDSANPTRPAAGSWALSLPQGTTNSTNNVLLANIANVPDKNGAQTYYSGDGIEFWGNGTSSNNIIQGFFGGGIGWGFGSAKTINNNTIQGPTMSHAGNVCSVAVPNLYIYNEECSSPVPTMSGNVTGATVTPVTSFAPTISPSSGNAPLTVTLTDSGYPSGPQPLGNTGIWYTTDGSTPVPGSGTARRLDSGGTFTMSGGGTVKAVGMWGALNQPASYPSGFGFVPSAPVSATFTSGPCGTNNTILITTFGGAVGDGTTDNTTAIQNTFNFAHTNGCLVEIPAAASSFAYSNVLTMNGITVFGIGPQSILKATNASNSAVKLTGTAPSLSNVVLLGTGATRNTGPNQSEVWVSSATGYLVNNVLINGGSCTGIWDQSGSTGTETNNTVENTLADSITNTNGANQILIQNNLVINSGDDGISNNSYTTDGNTVNHITVNQNAIMRNAFARGLEVSGGSNISFTGNYVDNQTGYADLILTSETSSFQTQAVNTVTVSGNTFVQGGTNRQGALFLWPDGASNSLLNLTLNGNRFQVSNTFTAVQTTGAGSISSSTLSNSQAYVTPNAGFFSGSSTGITQTSNTSFTTASYPGPLNPIVAGTVPVFSLPGGTYSLPQPLTLVEITSGDAIKFCTVGGSGPCTPATAYSGAIAISTPQTICATGTNSNSATPITSAPVCATYNGGASGPAATPVLTPGTESFFNSVSVSISNSTPGATIYYTTNGTTPTTSSPVYSASIPVTATTTIQAMAAAVGFTNSTVASATYTLAIPAFTSCNQANTGSVNSVAVAGAAQQATQCFYSASGETLACSPTADKYGDVVTAWGASNGNITVGAIGNAPGCGAGLNGPGCVTGISAGTANSTASVGAHICSPWGWTVTNSPPTLLSATVTLQGGGTAVNTGSAVQGCANMFYTGSITTQLCGTGTDSFGTVISNWTSSSPANATVVSATGVLTGVAAGATNLGVTAGAFSPSLAVTVNTPITGVNVQFGGAQISGAQIQ